MTAASPLPAARLDRATPAATAVVAIVAHARAVPSLQREAFADALVALPADPRRIVIRTCHRVELYAAAGAPTLDQLPELPPGTRRLEDVDAVQHLIAVASGLDSAVFGETQILHQLRETIEAHRGGQTLDPILDRLFQAAFRAGREARAFFTGPPRSLADLALDRIAANRGPIDGRPILVVGAGRMGRLAAFAANRRGAAVIVANRTPERGAALAQELGGSATGFGADGQLEPVAGVIVASAGPWPVGPTDLEMLRATGATIVDLSSPPAVPGEVQARLGSGFISVDDLADAAADGPTDRQRLRLERLVDRAGSDYCRWLRNRAAVPAIQAVVNVAEERRQTEVEWLRRRRPDMTAEDLALVEQMSHRLVAALLHAPLSALGADDDGDLEPAARELFGL